MEEIKMPYTFQLPAVSELTAEIQEKVMPYWTDEDTKRLNELYDEQREAADAIPPDAPIEINSPLFNILFKVNTQIAQLCADIEYRYIKNRGERGLFSDVKDILRLLTKEEFLFTVIDPSEETFENAYIFCRECLRVQAIGLGEERIRALIEKHIAAWYKKPPDFNIQLFYTRKQATGVPCGPFSIIRQGPVTNTFSKMEIRHNDKQANIDPITGAAKAHRGDFCIAFPGFTELAAPDLKQSTHQLLDMAVSISTATGGAQSITFSLDEYMQKRGLKDRKEARKQAEADLKALHKAKLSFKEKRKGKTRDYFDINILDAQGIRNGIISITFGATLFNILLNYPVMPYPAELWTFNSQKNPNSYYLLRKIAELKNMNIGKKNEDIIAVKTLIENCPALPKYEEVIKTDKAVTRRIIERFERDLDAIEIINEWRYCHSKDAPLTDEELKNMDYKTFIKLYIKIDWGENYIELPRQKKPIKKKSK